MLLIQRQLWRTSTKWVLPSTSAHDEGVVLALARAHHLSVCDARSGGLIWERQEVPAPGTAERSSSFSATTSTEAGSELSFASQ